VGLIYRIYYIWEWLLGWHDFILGKKRNSYCGSSISVFYSFGSRDLLEDLLVLILYFMGFFFHLLCPLT